MSAQGKRRPIRHKPCEVSEKLFVKRTQVTGLYPSLDSLCPRERITGGLVQIIRHRLGGFVRVHGLGYFGFRGGRGGARVSV